MPSVEEKEVIGYALEPRTFEQLRQIASQLQGGSDRDRDIGHRIWLIITGAEPITSDMLK